MDYSDIINELSKRYKELQEEFKSVQDLVNDIDFVFDYTEEEQWLFYRMRSTMEEHCGALLRLIRFLKKQELEEQGIKDWTQYKKTDSTHIGVDVSDEGDHGACSQVCGDGIDTHHCGQDAEEPRHNYRAMVEDQGIHIHDGNVPLDQCGCIKICKVGGGNATVQDPNESQPADTVPESLKELVTLQIEHVFPANHKCDKCDYYTSCNRSVKKLELVGGYMLCLAPLPNSIVTE